MPEINIAKYRGNKTAAFSLQFDDSTPSQADFAVPHLNARGLTGTFYINPGSERYQLRKRIWEEVCPLWGHELANHTMLHQGAKDYAEADQQIGDCSRLIWSLYPDRSPLLAFQSGGGTTWGINGKQMAELRHKYRCVIREGLSIESNDPNTPLPFALSLVDKALKEGGWESVFFHGVGPRAEWLGTTGEFFDALLDHVAKHKDKLWVGGWAEIHRYTKERDAAVIEVLNSSPDSLKFKINTPGLDPELYTEPLTLITQHSSDWAAFAVEQGGKTISSGTVNNGAAVFDASPNKGPITLTKADHAAAIPSSKPDLKNIMTLVQCGLLQGLTPSSLMDLPGDIGAFVFKGADRAVAALWYHGRNPSTPVAFHDVINASIGIKFDKTDLKVPDVHLEDLRFSHKSGGHQTLLQGKFELTSKPFYIRYNTCHLEDFITYGITLIL